MKIDFLGAHMKESLMSNYNNVSDFDIEVFFKDHQ